MQPPAARQDDPFHAGERAVHTRLGIAERMQGLGQKVIRDHLPEQHQQFYQQLPLMLVGSVDAAARPWASVLVGAPGFMQAAGARQLDIAAQPIPGDPLAQGLQAGAPLGFLGIELHTRRRNRMNGHVLRHTGAGFSVQVAQTVGNCPQYIQGREMHWARPPQDQQPRAVQALDHFDAATRAFIGRADTLFVATHAPAAEGEPARGADVSHRGGRSGFVKVEDAHTLLVPDFTGNFFFMTLGNLQLNPRAGVLFIDFETGDLLTLTGRAEVVWDGGALQAFDGAERAWRFRVESGWWLRDALPLRWTFRDWSPHSVITGTWDEAARRQALQQQAQTWRPYRVTRTVDESSVIRSLHLEPDDGHGVPPFEAGQHLPIRLRLPDGSWVNRTYTISHAPSDGSLRLSVKREGVASQHLHDRVRVGDRIEALGPRGQFTIDAKLRRPAVLIGAGVGITPMVGFARHLVAEGFRNRRVRPTHLIQVARNAGVRAFGTELDALVQRANGAVKLHLVLDMPGDGVHAGPLNTDLLKTLLPFDDHEFFLCGPPGFMQSLYEGLRDLGVRDARIQAESFGPSALKRRLDVQAAPVAAVAPASPPAQLATVVFQRSGQSASWTPASGSLLELAEAEGLAPPFSCRAGHCGSCVTRLNAGLVTYPTPTAWRPAEGEVLLCCAVPAADEGAKLQLEL